MFNLRYNEVNQKDIKSIDDIDKIVKQEKDLENKNNILLKKSMISAKISSVIIKVFLVTIFFILSCFFAFIVLVLIVFFKSHY